VLPMERGLALVVGDVAGHGAAALAAAQRVRARLRMSLVQGRSPGEALGEADVALSSCAHFDMATAVVAAVDSLSGLVTWSVAGHLPPLFLAREPRFGKMTDVPLGVGKGRRRHQQGTPLPSRGMLLFTDGVIERRGKSLDDGLAALASAVSRHRDLGVDMLCARVMREMVPPRPADDVCVLVARRAR
jgi:two-component system, chemotaxis family, sensor kinase Cph1